MTDDEMNKHFVSGSSTKYKFTNLWYVVKKRVNKEIVYTLKKYKRKNVFCLIAQDGSADSREFTYVAKDLELSKVWPKKNNEFSVLNLEQLIDVTEKAIALKENAHANIFTIS